MIENSSTLYPRVFGFVLGFPANLERKSRVNCEENNEPFNTFSTQESGTAQYMSVNTVRRIFSSMFSEKNESPHEEYGK